jgi:hypothetical protein
MGRGSGCDPDALQGFGARVGVRADVDGDLSPDQLVVIIRMVPVLGRDLVGARRGQIVEAEAGERDALVLRRGDIRASSMASRTDSGPATR